MASFALLFAHTHFIVAKPQPNFGLTANIPHSPTVPEVSAGLLQMQYSEPTTTPPRTHHPPCMRAASPLHFKEIASLGLYEH